MNREKLAEAMGNTFDSVDIVLDRIRENLIFRLLYGRKHRLTGIGICKDGRKRSKVIRVLKEHNLIEDFEENYVATEAALDFLIPREEVDMYEIWKQKVDSSGYFKRPLGFLTSNDLTEGQIRTLIEDSDTQYLIINSWVIRNGSSTLKEKDVVFLTLDEAREKTSFTSDETLCFTSTLLRNRAQEDVWNQTVDMSYNQNISWGLNNFGILTEKEAELLNQKLTNRVGGVFPSSGSQGLETPDWEKNVSETLVELEKQKDQLEKLIKTYKAIRDGIKLNGGWDEFLPKYRQRLDEALKEQQNKKETA